MVYNYINEKSINYGYGILDKIVGLYKDVNKMDVVSPYTPNLFKTTYEKFKKDQSDKYLAIFTTRLGIFKCIEGYHKMKLKEKR